MLPKAWHHSVTKLYPRRIPRIRFSSLYIQSGFLGHKYARIRQDTRTMPTELTRSQPDSLDSSSKHVDKKPRLGSATPQNGDSPSHLARPSNPTLMDRPAIVQQTERHPKPGKPAWKEKTSKKSLKKKQRDQLPEPCSSDDVLAKDVAALLGQETIQTILADGTERSSPFEYGQELELVVSELSSNGESLSVVRDSNPPWVVITPFALPGETIRARVYRNARLHSYADFLEVLKPNEEMRDMSRVKCRYFGKCAGCQYQMLSYDTQLSLKRGVIVKAYQNFSDLPSSSVPPILPTIGSPLQYGYRTKITPHFDTPAKDLKRFGLPEDGGKPDWFHIGFNKIGTRHVMDIEECPIATPVVNKALGPIRDDIIKKLPTYKKGVSLLLRESLEIPSLSTSTDWLFPSSSSTAPPPPVVKTGESSPDTADDLASQLDKKLCVTDHKGMIRERVGPMLFEYTAGSFFQNNNSVLVPLTDYVRDAIFPPSPLPAGNDQKPTHLVDAYCGSGLFALTLSPSFEQITGIELSTDSIKAAKRNVELNQLSLSFTTETPPIPEDKQISFLAGDAADIFSHVKSFPRAKTVLIIDPPRKGADEKFIDQLIEFGCGVVVYVSCNVHTQARDVGMILRKSKEKAAASGLGKVYRLESIRGFDLFPQTAHVESVAVLKLVDVGDDVQPQGDAAAMEVTVEPETGS